MSKQLYGDGYRDDTEAIQELLDTGSALVHLPPPSVAYIISKPLKIHSGQTLKLDDFSVVRLAPNSNCPMVENSDKVNGNTNVTLWGGIWDMQNLLQAKNPFHFPFDGNDTTQTNGYFRQYTGVTLRFFNVVNLTVRDLTVKDPITFAIQMANIHQATVDNIRFDFNDGNPWPVNMDGVHLDGGCRFVRITNLKGSCYDDMVALNADDGGYCGPIEDIEVDGIFTDNCHSAVRILSTGSPVRRVSISNVYGTFYQYAVGFTKYFGERDDKALFEYITMDRLYISKAERYTKYQKDGTFVYPLIWVENDALVRHLHIRDLYRHEEINPIPTIGIDPDGRVEGLLLDGVMQENTLGERIPVIHNQGMLIDLSIARADHGDDPLIVNEGTLTEK